MSVPEVNTNRSIEYSRPAAADGESRDRTDCTGGADGWEVERLRGRKAVRFDRDRV